MSGKATFETKLGRVMLGWFILVGILITLHIWNDQLGEHDAWMWSCHTMGNHKCGPNEPLVRFGTDPEE